jgi:hypothetical protein
LGHKRRLGDARLTSALAPTTEVTTTLLNRRHAPTASNEKQAVSCQLIG